MSITDILYSKTALKKETVKLPIYSYNVTFRH